MRDLNITVGCLGELAKAVSHYQRLQADFGLLNYPRGIEVSNRIEKLLEDFKSDKDYWKSPVYNNWNFIEIHISNQVWGSTSCGWGGMGGSAMTAQTNIIIYNLYIKQAFVYWGGELAYVCPIDEIKEGFRVPSIRDVKNAIFKKR